ncbi:MAG TPA: class I SAM-dependent methyltransferase [Solirubrobacterales bacterium]|jgi:SAM-dependent methyltransferase|nr:class I SAM-dependent methyltransferase [Solirubrobacterales bacterium]
MARDFYASPFGVAYSAYMERPRIGRRVARIVWSGDTRPYYESMTAVAELPAGGTIVDCPCGAGPALRALDPERDVRYIGADLSPAMLRRIRRRAAARGIDGLELHHADAADLPLEDDTADLFLSYWGLHCFDDPVAAVAEMARVTKPDGRLVGSSFVHARDTMRQRLLIRPGLGDFGPMGTEAEIRGWLEDAGFRPSSWERRGSMLYFDAGLDRA